MSFLRKKTQPLTKKSITLNFDEQGNLITKLNSTDEKIIFNSISNKHKNKIEDLKNAIQMLNSKFIFERKNLFDLREQVSKKKELLLKTDDEMLYQCKICYENIIDTVLPCGHVFCATCAFSSKAADNDYICPICRTVIKKSKKIFLG